MLLTMKKLGLTALLATLLVAAVTVVAITTGGPDGKDARRDARSATDAKTSPSPRPSPSTDNSPSTAAGPAIPYVVLKPGECFDHPRLDRSVRKVTARSCGVPHDGQVISNRTLTGDFGSDAALRRKAMELCEADAKKQLKSLSGDGRFYYFYALYPTRLTYDYQNQDEISCALTLSDKRGGPKLSAPLNVPPLP
ncbi:hypothetical protein G5C51_23905 [Streptomyces sp. A7024]|uniref:Septum formation-related domain-containing protein n=1 Tax=Streptomyces coryli TaxID=1128680 RepID=A0A6G4U6C3_9ACTN|nr:hypothetical protein [Streptomyces coryli]NGN66938.1 hypothetical protein [Streptomyces coryli]